MEQTLPSTQNAIQLIGPDELRLNESKEVFRPGPHQILAKVEAVGLCFSDLKLLKQFANHVRKGEVVSGVPGEVLAEIPLPAVSEPIPPATQTLPQGYVQPSIRSIILSTPEMPPAIHIPVSKI